MPDSRVRKSSISLADWSSQHGATKGWWLIWEDNSGKLYRKRISMAVFDVLKTILPHGS